MNLEISIIMVMKQGHFYSLSLQSLAQSGFWLAPNLPRRGQYCFAWDEDRQELLKERGEERQEGRGGSPSHWRPRASWSVPGLGGCYTYSGVGSGQRNPLGIGSLPGAPLGCELRFRQSCLGLEGWGLEGTAGLHCCYCRCRAFGMLPGEDGYQLEAPLPQIQTL